MQEIIFVIYNQTIKILGYSIWTCRRKGYQASTLKCEPAGDGCVKIYPINPYGQALLGIANIYSIKHLKKYPIKAYNFLQKLELSKEESTLNVIITSVNFDFK